MQLTVSKEQSRQLEEILNPFHEFFKKAVDKAVERAGHFGILNRLDAKRFYGFQLRTGCPFARLAYGERIEDSYENFVPYDFEKAKQRYDERDILIGDPRIAAIGWGVNVIAKTADLNERDLSEVDTSGEVDPIKRLAYSYMELKNTFFPNWRQTWPLDSLTMPLCQFEVPHAGVMVGMLDVAEKQIAQKVIEFKDTNKMF